MSAVKLQLQPDRQQQALKSNLLPISLNLTLIGLWLWLYKPVFNYLAIIFSGEDFRTNQLVLIGVLILIAFRIQQGGLRPKLTQLPHFYPPAFGLAVGGSIFYLFTERFLDVNTLSATLFAFASYGLLGLWMQPLRWRQGLPATLLIIGVLPLGDHLQTFIGYPMRIATAAIIRDGLMLMGITSIGIDTILVLENGVSKIDLPCSGVKSLWTGMLFLLASTWLERRALNRRWLLTASLFIVLLFGANLARIGILVLVGQVGGWQLSAKMLHIPLGALGFVGACAGAVALLRLQAPLSQDAWQNEARHTPIRKRQNWLSILLIFIIFGMALIYTPRPQTGLTQPAPTWNFPVDFKTKPLPLKADELAWFIRDGAESADRHRFAWHGLSGSMILVTSKTWRAHHRPERCFEVYGLSLNDSRTFIVAPNFPLRLVSLGDDDGHNLLSATYWFQSSTRTTDDYASRIWADLSPRRERWVLVSILFDQALEPNSTEVQSLYTALHNSVAQKLNGN